MMALFSWNNIHRIVIFMLLIVAMMVHTDYVYSENSNDTDSGYSGKAIWLFSGRSCGSCESIEAWLKDNAIPYQLINIDEMDGYRKLVAQENRLKTEAEKLPVLIFDDTLVGGQKQILDILPKVKTWYFDAASPQATAAETSSSGDSAGDGDKEVDQTITGRYNSLSFLTVAGMGLADGINPCAFATIAFLVGCLLGSGGEKKRAVFVGFSFTGGVFLTYLMIGFGAFKALFVLQEFQSFRSIFHVVTLGLLGLGIVLMVIDAVHAWKTGGKLLLRLPKRLREKTNLTIAKGLHTSRWLVGGFVFGCTVSLLELACTGQVYLPTILYVMEKPELAGQATLYLILYNIMFIVPLLIVLGLSLKGMQTKVLWNVLKKHAAVSRLLCAGLFGVMFWAVWR